MINYINSDGKICNGVGMQSHLSTSYPSVAYYTQAVQSFVNAGFEVQITELDATNKGDQDLANYLYSLMKNVISIKKAGGKITGTPTRLPQISNCSTAAARKVSAAPR